MAYFIGDLSGQASDWDVPAGIELAASSEPPQRKTMSAQYGPRGTRYERRDDLQAMTHEAWGSRVHRICKNAGTVSRIAALHLLESMARTPGELQAAADNGSLRRELIMVGIPCNEVDELLSF